MENLWTLLAMHSAINDKPDAGQLVVKGGQSGTEACLPH